MTLDIPAGDWQVQHLRVTVFPVSPLLDKDPAAEWWEQLLEQSPDSRNSEPKLLKFVDKGVFKNGQLVLARHLVRIDLLYMLTDEQQLSEKISSLGDLKESLLVFLPIADAILSLPDLPEAKRLAFGAALRRQVTSVREGNRILADNLPALNFDTSTVRDLLFRVNRPIESSACSDLELNRLSTWSLERMISTYSQVDVGAPKIFNSLSSADQSSIFCKLELDINTAAENMSPLDKGLLLQLLKELTGAASKIADEGDRE